jgi:hypothetical protein
MRIKLTLAALCGITLLIGSAAAQTTRHADIATPGTPATPAASPAAPSNTNKSPDEDGPVGEVEDLRRRVEELEQQNRALARALVEINAKLGATTRAETAVVVTTETAASAPARAVEQPVQPSASAPRRDDPYVRWSEILGEGNRVKLYGFLRLDLDFDSQRPNNGQIPFFITSPDARAGGAGNGNFSMHPRLTRFGVDYTGPTIRTLGDARLNGKFEVDFENGGSESRQIIRIRHAYLRLGWKDFSLTGGQTWDAVSPLFPTVNHDSLMWNAGNVGDRRPQLRGAYERKAGRGKLSLVGAAGLTGAVDGQDLDANGFRDGEESALPNLQGRAGYAYPVGKGREASFGVSGFYGFMKTTRAVAGRTEFNSQLVNLDLTLPLHSRVTLRGEGWWGRNLSDVRGGAGQGINLATGREIRGRGGWGEATFHASRYLSITPGFTTDDPVDLDLPAGGRTRNRAFYLGNRITPGGNFAVGADYLRWRTDYKGLLRGVNNRVNIFLQYNF